MAGFAIHNFMATPNPQDFETTTIPHWRTRATILGRFVLWTAAFALSYTQAPLYYSNQNQYFVHGLAQAGHGTLADDWLANTRDPNPIFSFVVAFTASHLHEYLFYLYYAVLQGIYWLSLIGLFAPIAGNKATPRRRIAFLTLLMMSHAAVLRWGSYRLFGSDYPCYFQGWLAAQYVLGAVFQPSAFGVLLVLSVTLFVRGQPHAAVAAAALGAVAHSTYLLGAGMLTLAFIAVYGRRGQWRTAGRIGLLALGLVTPIVVYDLVVFRPTTATDFAEAQRILACERIPHHCQPAVWWDGIAAAQVVWVAVAIALTRRTVLFPVLGIVFLVSIILTLFQMMTRNDTLALLFPWRTSVILIPLATTIILARLVCWGNGFDHHLVAWTGSGLIGAIAISGAAILWFHQGFQTNGDELPLLEFVRTNKTHGDIYLLPVQIPKAIAMNCGSISSDFKPLPAKRSDTRLIPFDFQRFRLSTGAPIFVDFKAIPYKDVEVLEWYRRVRWNEEVYLQRDWDRDDTLAEVRRQGITHVVTTTDRPITCSGLVLIYADDSYHLFRVP
jgi:hypothetical protein